MHTTRRSFLWASSTLMALGLSGAGRRALAQSAVAPAADRMSDAQVVAALRARLEQLAAADMFSGAVLLAKNGHVLFEKAYGYADHAFKAPNQADTKFNLGSLGKMFTAVAVLQLAQQGKLSVDDTLIKLAHCLTKNVSEIASLPHVRNLSEVPPAQAEGGADREAEHERATGSDPGASAALSQGEQAGERADFG